jgi:hypothetical protein
MSLVSCRYNPNHQVKSSRLIIHEKKCPNRFNGRAIQSEDDPNLKIIVGSNNYNESSSSQKKYSDIKYMEKIKEQNIEKEEETNKKFEELRKQMYSNDKEYNERIKKENEFKKKKKKKKKKNTNNNQTDKLFSIGMDEIKNDNPDSNHFYGGIDNFSEEENNINENEFDNKKLSIDENKISNNLSDFENVLEDIDFEDFYKIIFEYDPNKELEQITERNKNYFDIDEIKKIKQLKIFD